MGIAGAALILVSGPIYFFLTDWGAYALAYIVLTAVPAVIWLACGLIERRRHAVVPIQPTPPAL